MLLQVKNGSFAYVKENPILHGITFSLNEGAILAVMGPNGIGKTTLLKCLMGVLKWQSGRSLIDGRDSSLERRKIGYVPQAHRLTFELCKRFCNLVLYFKKGVRCICRVIIRRLMVLIIKPLFRFLEHK